MISAGRYDTRRTPSYDAGNAWYKVLPKPEEPRRLVGDITADWAILGAGTCGLTIARRLAELRPDDTIAIIEASRVGFGASGRNAGFMLNHNTHSESKDFAVEERNGRLCQGDLRASRHSKIPSWTWRGTAQRR